MFVLKELDGYYIENNVIEVVLLGNLGLLYHKK